MIDLYASEAHFLEHLAPTWKALRPEFRGTATVADGILDTATALGIVANTAPPLRHRARPMIVASGGDLRLASRVRDRVVLFEHGAGQSYGTRHISYAGGRGRERVVLFVVPNEMAAARNRIFYPTTANAVVGSPRVDALAKIPRRRGPRPLVALSFHWRSDVCPESGTAWDHYVGHLAAIRAELDAAGVDVIGHSHPRLWPEAGPAYRAAGIEEVPWWPEVVARADLYACDNSSTLFEFAATGRPVLLLNAPWYRRHVHHGLRFWSEAEVGLQVDRPEDVAPLAVIALQDPPEVARVREEVIDRVYPVRDGAARRAAIELEVLVTGRRCPVCGEAHSACGPASDVVAVDETIRQGGSSVGGLKKYPNPERPGAFVLLNDRDAARLGLTGTHVGAHAPVLPPAPDAFLNQDAATPDQDPAEQEETAVATAPPSPADDTPEGALRPSGPTRRARARAASVPAPDPASDDPGTPSDKARPAPTPGSRRRRRPVGEPEAKS